MNLDTLSLYCDVIRSGSFSLGAAAHRISQSAASQAVRQLEDELGAQLIDRTKRPFMVTPEGRKFFDACLTLLENYEQAKIRLAYLHPNAVVDAVIGDEADLGILSFPQPHRSLTIIPWHSEPMIFVCHRSHRLAKRRGVSPKEFESEKFVAFEGSLR